MFGMEKVDPAIPKVQTTTIVNDVVFQSMLISWLEEKGFIQDVRSQIRFHLVNVLKNTALGRNTCKKISSNKSVSTQAINMIVAEYLLKNEYHYSLSVFMAESSLVSVIPDIALKSSNGTDPSKPMFKNEDILNIFELLGISKASLGRKILNLYHENSNSILFCLICILNMQVPDNEIIKQPSQSVATNKSNPVKQIHCNISKNVLLDSDKNCENIQSQHLQELNRCIKEREVTEKLMTNLSRSNDNLKKGLSELTKNCYIMKNRKKGDFIKRENLKYSHSKCQKESDCLLQHCGANCINISANLKKINERNSYLEKENSDLKIQNAAQQRKHLRLSMRYNNLVSILANSEYKPLPVSTHVNTEDGVYKSCKTEKSNPKKKCEQQNELISETLTEDLVRETWYRLGILEDESHKIQDLISLVKIN